jgi:hypothetical protein
MDRKLNAKLRPFFDAKTSPLNGPAQERGADRYIPRALTPFGGPGWRVWDHLEKRFLTDEETRAISAEALMDERLPN